MAEVEQEATHVWCHKTRLVLFFSAMRHFRDELKARGLEVHYHELGPNRSHDRGHSFAEVLEKDVRDLRPGKLIVLEPGDWRVRGMLEHAAGALDLDLEIRGDRHFYCGIDEFKDWAKGRKSLLLENFYRELRKRHHILLDGDGRPLGGQWNFDKDNRERFGKDGPGKLKAPRGFRRDRVTDAVIALVEQRFKNHPGSSANFDLPVTGDQADAALRDFIQHRLASFGRYQDALWAGQPFLYHSRLSAALNLHLLNPRTAVDAAVAAFQAGAAPLNSVEGFVRQVLGWREYVRGVYGLHMPEYAERNALHTGDTEVPKFFWDGDTEMRCVADAMSNVVGHAYAHHIQRLMVLGLFAQLAGVHPYRFHQWHLAMYADAIDWVSLPNALGMSQFGDGGVVGTKPYCASGNYINRMGNYCGSCRYDHRQPAGDDACPFTTLYWDFLDRHYEAFKKNPRLAYQLRNLEKKSEAELKAVRSHARRLKESLSAGVRL